MPEQSWYLYQDGTQQGPMDLAALRALADQGKLKPDGLVTKIGMTDWVPARSVPELFPDEAMVRPPLPPGVGPRRDVLALGRGLAGRLRRSVGADDVIETLPHLRAVRGLLALLRRGLTERGLHTADRVARQSGHLAFMAAAVILVLAFLILGVRGDSLSLFFGALLLGVPAAVVLHFLAVLFLEATPALLRKSSSELATSAVLAFFALAFLVGSLYCLLMGLSGLIRGEPFLVFGLYMAGFAVLLYACAVALNPTTLNVAANSEISAGEEALGIGMFVVKLPVRLVPFLFGVGSAVALFAAFYLLFLAVAEETYMVTGLAYQTAWRMAILALLPFLAYVGFALSFLLVDLFRAILRTPGRIDALRRDVNGGR